jgi:hypothetical protein
MALLDRVKCLISDCNVGPLVCTRRDPRVQNRFGGFDPAPAQTFSIDPIAAVNATGRSLGQSPEADRNAETVEFYVRSDISYPAGVDPRPRVADVGDVPDVITYRGRNFRCTQVEDYLLQGDVYLITATLEDLQTDA